MVYVFLANGFEEIEALAFVDILRRAKINVQTVSVDNTGCATGSHSIKVSTDINIDEVNKEDAEAVVLPGGMPGTLNLQKNEKVIEYVNYANDNGKLLGAICAAPMILGELNILNGKKATCYPGFEEHLKGADTTGAKCECDENIITAKGAGATHEFAHCFVTILKDEKTADNIISAMQY